MKVPGARMVLVVASGVVATLVFGVPALAIAWRRPLSPSLDRLARWWSRGWLVPAGVQVAVEGLEHIDPRGGYVVVSNHLSTFDIMVLFVALPLRLRFMAKRELYSIPLFGSILRALGMVQVDRSHPDKEAINRQAAYVLSSGRSIVAFAEGRRSPDGSLGAFKAGAFAIATATGAPVCPVTIEGSRACWASGERTIHPGRVRVVVGHAIDTAALGLDQAGRLRDEVRQVIAGTYQRLTPGTAEESATHQEIAGQTT